MRRPGVLACVALVLLLVGLPGCSGKPTTKAPQPSSQGSTAVAGQGVTAPTWAVRDYWTYDFNGAPTTYVVTSDAGTDWIVDTDSDERAFADARDDVSRMGPQRKSDLAGSQGDERVEFFHWPMQDNQTWKARWDHQDVIITSHAAGTVFALEARDANGTTVYRYTYDPAIGWFRELHHLAPDGSELVGLTLKQAGHNWTGTALRYQVKSLYDQRSSGPATAGGTSVQPEAGTTDLWIEYHLTCTGVGGFSVSFEPVDKANPTNLPNEGHTASGPCQTAVDQALPVTGPMDGPWALAYDWGSQATTWSIVILQRTLMPIPVG